MVEDETPAQIQSVSDGRGMSRITLGGDEFLDSVVEAISGDDMEKRAWARMMMDHEDTVAGFVANVRRALRAVREARGLSIDAAAAQVGVSSSALARLETGATAQADLKLVARVALLLGVVPRLDFAERGSAATVSVNGLQAGAVYAQGFDGSDQSHRSGHPISQFESAQLAGGMADADVPASPAPQDPTALDQRIRDLEARIAAMENPRSGDSD